LKKRPASVKLENDGSLLTLRAVTVTTKSVGPTITVTSRLGSAGTAVTGYARPAWADSESGLCSVTVTLWADSESVRGRSHGFHYYVLPSGAGRLRVLLQALGRLRVPADDGPCRRVRPGLGSDGP
jgi:hypothetical protein